MATPRFPVKPGDCWRTAELMHKGLLPPDADRTQCLAPCPPMNERCQDMFDLMTLASRQLRGGMDLIGFDWNVIEMLAVKAGIDTYVEWWELFALAERTWITTLHDKAKKKD